MSINPDRAANIEEVRNSLLRELLASELPSDEALLAAHPDIAVELAAELRKLRMFQGMCTLLDQTEWNAETVIGRGESFELRCPECYTAQAVDVDAAIDAWSCASCGAKFGLAFDDSPGLVGSSIAHFDLLELLGTGGFGTVWKAHDTQLDRLVAVKIPRRGQLTAAGTEMFLREARTAAQLHHPGIVQIHEFGRVGNSVYIVSELIDGVSLAAWLAERRMTALEAADLCSQLASALAHAHARGVIHRDLKPANILLSPVISASPVTASPDGSPNNTLAVPPHRRSSFSAYLTDFGLARRETGELTITLDGQLLGTPDYMSPEQARGNSHTSDARSDLFSLGVILYQLLTGELPFRGSIATLLHQVIHDEPLSPRRLVPSVPKDLETITLKCLEKDPLRRYSSAQDLKDDLERFLRHEAISARPSSHFERGRRWCKRRPAVAGLLAAITMLVLTIVSGSLWLSRSLIQTTQNARLGQYVAEINLAQREENRSARVRSVLDRYAPQSENGDLAGWEWQLLRREWNGAIRTFTGHTQSVNCVTATADGRLLATGANDDTVRVWETATGKLVRTLHIHRGAVRTVRFSRDGTVLASAGNDGVIYLTDTADGRLVRTLSGHDGAIAQLVFHPEDVWLASASDDGTARLWNWRTGEPGSVLRGHTEGVASVDFSPDGSLIATGSWDANVRLWNTSTGEASHVLRGHRGRVVATFMPDQEHLLSAGYDNILRAWRVSDGDQVWASSRLPLPLSAVSCAPDGHTIATASWDGLARLWDPERRNVLRQFRGHDGGLNDVTFIGDGWRIATACSDGQVRLFAAGQEPQELIHRPLGEVNGLRFYDAQFSSDGKLVAVLCNDNSIAVVQPETGLLRHLITVSSRPLSAIATCPHHPWLASGCGDGTVQFWELGTGDQRLAVSVPAGGADVIRFHPTRDVLIATGKNAMISICSTTDSAIHSSFRLPGGAVLSLDVHPTSEVVATGHGTGEIWLHDLTTGQSLATLDGHQGPIVGIRFSRDGQFLASASSDQTVRVWDYASRRLLHVLRGSDGGFLGLAFSPDGQRLAASGLDWTVSVWDSKSGLLTAVLANPHGACNSISFGFHEDLLVTATDDAALKIWNARPLGAHEGLEREAAALASVLARSGVAPQDFIEKLRADHSISEEVRSRTIALIGTEP